jgi:excisionase family DNA binding protein
MSRDSQPRFLRVDEVAAEARVSRSTVRHWLRVGRLPSAKLGRRRVVPREAFEAIVARGMSRRVVD